MLKVLKTCIFFYLVQFFICDYVDCYVKSILFYGRECWIICSKIQGELQAPGIWFYKRILKLSWTDRESNEDVLKENSNYKNAYAQNQKKTVETSWGTSPSHCILRIREISEVSESPTCRGCVNVWMNREPAHRRRNSRPRGSKKYVLSSDAILTFDMRKIDS